MARLTVAPISPELREAFEPIIEQKVLNDDQKWEETLLPLFLDRISSIEIQIRQSLTSNINTPSTHTLDDITHTIARIRTHIEDNFSSSAPFTVRRIAELLLQYEESEYSLHTVTLAHKYLLALARLVCVQSKESAFTKTTIECESKSAAAENLGIPITDYNKFGLPKEIQYSRLLWEEAPITETILVKDKAELLEKVAEKNSVSKNQEKECETDQPLESEVEAESVEAESEVEAESKEETDESKIAQQDIEINQTVSK